MRLLLFGKGAVSAHRIERPFAARWTNRISGTGAWRVAIGAIATRQKEHSWRVVLARQAHALLAQRLAATRRGGTPVSDWPFVAL